MEIKQYQPGEKQHVDRTRPFVITPYAKRVRGGFDTKKKEFNYTVYNNGKKATIKIF